MCHQGQSAAELRERCRYLLLLTRGSKDPVRIKRRENPNLRYCCVVTPEPKEEAQPVGCGGPSLILSLSQYVVTPGGRGMGD